MKAHSALRPAALAIALCSWMYSSQAVVPLADFPLFLSASPAPNVVLTLDDSGSMTRNYVPDALGDSSTRRNSPRFTAASYNGLYYNPRVNYSVPTRTDGVSYSTSFTTAYVNGFDTNRGSTNLSSSGYRPIYDCAPSDNRSDCSFTSPSGGVSSVTNYTYVCRATFQHRSNNRNDRIFVSNCSPAMPATGDGSPQEADNSRITASGASNNSYNRSYQVDSSEVDGSEIQINLSTSNEITSSANNLNNITFTWSQTSNLSLTNSPAFYHMYFADSGDVRPSGCDSSRETNACYIYVEVGSAKDIAISGKTGETAANRRQNFATWYSFYRSRALATMSASMNAVTQLGQNQVRLGWQTLNRSGCTSFGTTCTGYDDVNRENRIRTLDALKTGSTTTTHRTDFYNWVQRLSVSGSTPLRAAMNRAGEYFMTSGTNSPYADEPYVNQGTELACRRNFHVMLTDGLWNGNSGVSYGGDVDGTNATMPDGKAYTRRMPFADTPTATSAPSGFSYGDSLADIAFKYWSTDLRSGLGNTLLPYYVEGTAGDTDAYWNAKNNPATWQHMVNFNISFGLGSVLKNPAWGGSTYEGDYSRLFSGPTAQRVTWPPINPSASTSSSPEDHVYDLWHAAINSRGQFFSADDPQGINSAFSSVFTTIIKNNFSASSLATNSTRIDTGGTVFQARFNPEDWRGQLLAFPVNSNGVVQNVAYWDAAQKMPAHGDRKITTWTGTQGVDFKLCNALSNDQRDVLNRNGAGVLDNRCADRINWLRGDSSKEARNVTSNGLRNRTTTTLGDIINSDPAYVHTEDFGYGTSTLPEASSYGAFVAGKANRIPMIYVGANDGMLHGFRADVGNQIESGKEQMAHIPLGVFKSTTTRNISRLTDTSYVHTYFVDGSPTVGDAYLNNQWKTVLLGGLGAGGKSVYALDVTDPTQHDGTKVLWEYTNTDLGFTFSQPQIARVAAGNRWVAIFGNGYNSTADRAYLFVVDLRTGSLLAKIAAGTATSNGLSTPATFDSNNDRVVDYVYAGDLQGNVWKFDLTSTNTNSWGLANGGQPLFTARNADNQVQPITTKPAITVPSPQPNGGAMLYFGSGQYLDANDVSSKQVQTFYAVWDNGATTSTLTRSNLQAQTIDGEETKFGLSLRKTSSNTVDWTTRRGWYMDLIDALDATNPSRNEAHEVRVGERVVSAALVRYDRVIFVTITPSGDPCVAGGTSWLMELNALSGARMSDAVFDLNNDGQFDGQDLLGGNAVPSGVKIPDGISKTPTWLENETNAYKQLSISTGAIGTIGNRKPVSASGPSGGTIRRIFWQQIQ